MPRNQHSVQGVKQKLLLTCEHAVNHVPQELRRYFVDKAVLKTHRAYDIGAEYVCQALASSLRLPAIYAQVSRLVVDLNRSPHHPVLHSEFMREVPAEDKDKVIVRYYQPYRTAVLRKINSLLQTCDRVIHISVHSFTPVMNGVTRNADIGLLYDPSRKYEKSFASAWKYALLELDAEMRVRFNYPYKGSSDGLTTFLRKQFPVNAYVGIELEMNQSLLTGAADKRSMARHVSESLKNIK